MIAFALCTLFGASLEVGGNLRLLGGYLHFKDGALPDDGLGAFVGRLLLNGQLPGEVDFDFNGYVDLERGASGQSAGAFTTVSSFATPYRTRYLQWAFWQKDSVSGIVGVDRLRVHRSFGTFDLDVGRFPVNHSVTFLFTPNDFFAPFSAATLNRQYKPGVDAIRMRFGLTDWSNLEVLGVLGSTTDGVPAWTRSAAMLRLDATLANFQWALTGGKLAERFVVGGSLQGDVAGVVLRAEGHAGFPDRDGNFVRDAEPVHGRAAARVEYTFTWHNVSVGAEYAFFSDGAASTAGYLQRLARFFPDDLLYLGRHYAALNASIEIIPILNLAGFGMVNAQDGSGITSVSLQYNASNEVDILGGVLTGWGGSSTEMGRSPVAIFVEARVSF